MNTAITKTAYPNTDDLSDNVIARKFLNDPIVKSGREITQFLAKNARENEKLNQVYQERIARAEALLREIGSKFIIIERETTKLRQEVDAFINQCAKVQELFKVIVMYDERSSRVPPQDISQAKDLVEVLLNALKDCKEAKEACSIELDGSSHLPRSQYLNYRLDYGAFYRSYVFSDSPEKMLGRYIHSSKSLSELVTKSLEKIDLIEQKFKAISLKKCNEANEKVLKEHLNRIRDYRPLDDNSAVAIPLADAKIETRACSLTVEEDFPALYTFKTLLEKHKKVEDLKNTLTKLEHDFEEKLHYRNEMKWKVDVCCDLKNCVHFSELVASLGICSSIVFNNTIKTRSKLKQYASEIFHHMRVDVEEMNTLIKAIEDETDLDSQYMERMFEKKSMMEKFSQNLTDDHDNDNARNWESRHKDLVDTCTAIRNKMQNWDSELTNGGNHNKTYLVNLLSQCIVTFETRWFYFHEEVKKSALEVNEYDWIMCKMNNVGNFSDAVLKCETLISYALSQLR